MTDRSALELLLYSGAYDQVLARTADSRDPAAAPAVIGALALSGRLEEAESAYAVYVANADADGSTEARFFLIAGFCHAGQMIRAQRHARENLPALHRSDPRARFWVFQGLCLVRYFEGRFQRARRLARRALSAAVEASFPYARFLALDVLAHVSLQTGEVHAGMRLLSQAQALAQALGYADNASTERTEGLVFQLRMLLTDIETAVREVEEVVQAPEVSYFTRRNALIELAVMFALRGNAARATDALERARRIALPGADRRAKTRWLLGHALCAALSEGPSRARASLEEARASAGGQLALEAEVAFVTLVFFEAPPPERLAAYDEIAESTGIQRARVALDVARGRTELHPPRVEDGLARVLLECCGRAPTERARRVVAAGLCGLLPWALGVEPGRRIIVAESELVCEDHGSVVVRELPNRAALRLLFALRHGYRSRADLLREVWGIAKYVPSRHSAVLHTAISRLRLALGETEWVVTYDDGYALAQGVQVLTWDEQPDAAAVLPAPPPPDERDRVLRLIEQRGGMSSAQVAQELRLSPSTALRLLRRLADEGLLVKLGGGRATRYERA